MESIMFCIVSIITTNYDLICDKAIGIVHDTMHGYDDIGTAILDLRRAQHGTRIRNIWTVRDGRAVFVTDIRDW